MLPQVCQNSTCCLITLGVENSIISYSKNSIGSNVRDVNPLRANHKKRHIHSNNLYTQNSVKPEKTMCSEFPNSGKDTAEQIPESKNGNKSKKAGPRELQPGILIGKTVTSV